jgi:nitrilase
MITYPAFKAAAVHLAPVFLDLERTIDKVCSTIDEAARNGARLIVFPEAFVPAFPIWSAVRSPIKNHDFFRRLASNTMLVPGPELARVCSMVRKCEVFVSLGLNEGSNVSLGCIWNTNVLIGEDGSILNHHRKIVPTFFEKLVWANGDGAGLCVNETPLGKIGVLICGENTNPLARYCLMAQGEQVHVATYPPVWPTRDPNQGGNYDLGNAIRIRAGAHSFEAKCFTIVASSYMDKTMFRELAKKDKETARILDNTPRGVSMVIGPTGDPVSETLSDGEGILYADINIADCVEPKQFHDVVGYYNRFDIFKLTVDRSANRPIRFEAEEIEKRVEGQNEMNGEHEDEAIR